MDFKPICDRHDREYARMVELGRSAHAAGRAFDVMGITVQAAARGLSKAFLEARNTNSELRKLDKVLAGTPPKAPKAPRWEGWWT